jgi:mitochondrial fission process protein 1
MFFGKEEKVETGDESISSGESSSKEYNVFRDTSLRYLGYANEVGESFRYQFPRFVTPSYVVAFGYCVADAASNGYDTWNKYDDSNTTRNRETETALATGDTLLWQSLASVMIPGAAINAVVKVSRFPISQSKFLPTIVATWMPTAIGLSSIPYIVKPIDDFVDYVLNNSIRDSIKIPKSMDSTKTKS